MSTSLKQSISIRPLTVNDLPFLLGIRNSCRQYLHDTRCYNLEQCNTWYMQTKPEYYVLELEREPIGYFRTSDRSSESIYIGLDLEEKHRGKGYAIPAYEMFIGFLNLKTYYLRVLKHNTRACHIYGKLGFVIIEETESDLRMMLCR